MVEIALTPLVLSFASAAALGTALWVGGLGMLLGGAVASATGGPNRRARAMIQLTFVQGVILVAAGTRPSVILVAAAAFAHLACLPILMASNQALWSEKVPAQVQGCVQVAREFAPRHR
jgi:hypothetical protein